VPAGILLLGVEQYIPLTMYANSNAILGGGIEFLAADGLEVLGVKDGCIVIGPGKGWRAFLIGQHDTQIFPHMSWKLRRRLQLAFHMLTCTRHVFVETIHTRLASNTLTGLAKAPRIQREMITDPTRFCSSWDRHSFT
jgi:hypothetical protein